MSYIYKMTFKDGKVTTAKSLSFTIGKRVYIVKSGEVKGIGEIERICVYEDRAEIYTVKPNIERFLVGVTDRCLDIMSAIKDILKGEEEYIVRNRLMDAYASYNKLHIEALSEVMKMRREEADDILGV